MAGTERACESTLQRSAEVLGEALDLLEAKRPRDALLAAMEAFDLARPALVPGAYEEEAWSAGARSAAIAMECAVRANELAAVRWLLMDFVSLVDAEARARGDARFASSAAWARNALVLLDEQAA